MEFPKKLYTHSQTTSLPRLWRDILHFFSVTVWTHQSSLNSSRIVAHSHRLEPRNTTQPPFLTRTQTKTTVQSERGREKRCDQFILLLSRIFPYNQKVSCSSRMRFPAGSLIYFSPNHSGYKFYNSQTHLCCH